MQLCSSQVSRLYLVPLTQHSFPPSLLLSFFMSAPGNEFTLERIIDIGLDQFSDVIGEISSAASKELAIEQVRARGQAEGWMELASRCHQSRQLYTCMYLSGSGMTVKLVC